MKLVMSIINDEDVFAIMDVLTERGFSVTKLATTGGFLRSGNTTLICGIDDERVTEFIELIERKCKSRKQITSSNAGYANSNEGYIPYPIEVTVGGATIFVLNVDQFKKV